MGKVFEQIDSNLEAFIRAQQMFFVATAPLSASGHLNLSPKGLDALRILGPRSFCYLDYQSANNRFSIDGLPALRWPADNEPGWGPAD